MRIAFTSSDGKSVDTHFGKAQSFYLWEVSAATAEALGPVCLSEDGEEKEDRIVARATALEGCTLVYTTQIGGPAAAKLVRRHIHPVKTEENAAVAEAILQLQDVLKNKPPPWLRKAMNTSNPEPMKPANEEEPNV